VPIPEQGSNQLIVATRLDDEHQTVRRERSLEFMAENFRRHQCAEVFNGPNSTASAKSNAWLGVIIAVPERVAYLTADNQMTRKPNLALNAEIEGRP
jgi:hypothetical protein